MGLLMGTCDQLWPSGKVIYAHGVHQQSISANKRKMRDEQVEYFFPNHGTVEHGLPKRRALEAAGIQVPEAAYQLSERWVRDPATLTSTQLKQWGFAKYR